MNWIQLSKGVKLNMNRVQKINRDSTDTWTEVHLVDGSLLRFMGEDVRTLQEWITEQCADCQLEAR